MRPQGDQGREERNRDAQREGLEDPEALQHGVRGPDCRQQGEDNATYKTEVQVKFEEPDWNGSEIFDFRRLPLLFG